MRTPRNSGCYSARVMFAALLVFFPLVATTSYGQEDKPTLVVVDRSQTNDGLYHCSLHLAKDHPVELLVLVLYDRERKKCGEVGLASPIPTPHGKLVFFQLNHELVKNSVLQLHSHPFNDDRHTLTKFVVGERGAVRKENGMTVQVTIE